VSLTITVQDPLAGLLLSRAQVENVPVDELAFRLLETGIRKSPDAAHWTVTNGRRMVLIEKQFSGQLTDQEHAELQRLQELADRQLEELDAVMLKDVASMETTVQHLLNGAE